MDASELSVTLDRQNVVWQCRVCRWDKPRDARINSLSLGSQSAGGASFGTPLRTPRRCNREPGDGRYQTPRAALSGGSTPRRWRLR